MTVDPASTIPVKVTNCNLLEVAGPLKDQLPMFLRTQTLFPYGTGDRPESGTH